MTLKNILNSLQSRQIVMPYLENAFHQDEWPDEYSILVDSEDYYGLTDEEGVTHPTGPGDGYFHPSSHPLMTARELYYRYHPDLAGLVVPERRSLTSHMTLAAGTAMHAVIQTQLYMAGILMRGETDEDFEWTPQPENPDVVGRWVKKNPYEWEYINRRHMVRGRMDGRLRHPQGEIGFEFKSQNSRAFRFQDVEKDEWKYQTNLGLDACGLDRGVVLVMELGYPFNFKEFPITRNTTLLDEVYGKFDYVRECVANNTPPRCEHSYLSPKAKNCPVGHLCYQQTEIES
ncbi:Cas4 family exonuclease [Gordonia phage RedWattleHog]|uniref:Cas4 family exonuclease n=1 Tax=Gordonia phage Stormageddon TaxID=2656541 RepID=A0A649VTQ8_9CAUD|nr:exonuclease [Gordonia phage Stormageddon]QGJ94943.1 Cas4 family exonuclease [Gordonia phage Stormageddon]QLF83587.1 Cas4 family exonuclease [Gordonia phage RedWattleHog]